MESSTFSAVDAHGEKTQALPTSFCFPMSFPLGEPSGITFGGGE